MDAKTQKSFFDYMVAESKMRIKKGLKGITIGEAGRRLNKIDMRGKNVRFFG